MRRIKSAAAHCDNHFSENPFFLLHVPLYYSQNWEENCRIVKWKIALLVPYIRASQTFWFCVAIEKQKFIYNIFMGSL